MNTQCKESELGKMEKKLNRIRKRIEDKEILSKLQLEHMLFVVTLKECFTSIREGFDNGRI